MSARSSVIKAIASFCRVDSDTAFERHRSRIPINCDELETAQSLKKHLLSFLGLRELAIKYVLGEFDLKFYRMAPKQGLKKRKFCDNHRWSVENGAAELAGGNRQRTNASGTRNASAA